MVEVGLGDEKSGSSYGLLILFTIIIFKGNIGQNTSCTRFGPSHALFQINNFDAFENWFLSGIFEAVLHSSEAS